MPKRPRRSVILPLPHEGQVMSVEGAAFSSFLMNLHFGKLEQAMNFPNLPSRSISLPSLHLGHASPVSLGGSTTLPSSVRAPSHSGKREQLKNLPLRASLITIDAPHLGHTVPSGASPILVTLSIVSLLFTSLAKGV